MPEHAAELEVALILSIKTLLERRGSPGVTRGLVVQPVLFTNNALGPVLFKSRPADVPWQATQLALEIEKIV